MPRPTPGPWRYVVLGRTKRRVEMGAVVADSSTRPGSDEDVQHYGGHMVCESVSPVNARLIAAAPDLLEALDALEKSFGSQTDEDLVLWHAARDAIAKARGETEAAP